MERVRPGADGEQCSLSLMASSRVTELNTGLFNLVQSLQKLLLRKRGNHGGMVVEVYLATSCG